MTGLPADFPLATENRNRCTYRRENGHRCARVSVHWPLDAHYFREDGKRALEALKASPGEVVATESGEGG